MYWKYYTQAKQTLCISYHLQLTLQIKIKKPSNTPFIMIMRDPYLKNKETSWKNVFYGPNKSLSSDMSPIHMGYEWPKVGPTLDALLICYQPTQYSQVLSYICFIKIPCKQSPRHHVCPSSFPREGLGK